MKKLRIFLTAVFLAFFIVAGVQSQSPYTVPRLQQGSACSFVFLAADTTKTCVLGAEFTNSESHSIKLVMPAFAATNPTATFSIKDTAGATLYSISGIAENTTSYIQISRPLTSGSSYVILLTTTAGTGGGTASGVTWVYK